MIPSWAAALLALLGGLALVAGVVLVYVPAGVIVAGVLTLSAGLLIDSGRPRK